MYCVCIYYCIHAVVELFQKFVFWKFPKNKKSSENFVCEVFTKQRKNALIFTTHSWTSRTRSRGRGPAAHAVASARWHHLALFMPGPVRKYQGPSNSKLHCPHACNFAPLVSQHPAAVMHDHVDGISRLWANLVTESSTDNPCVAAA